MDVGELEVRAAPVEHVEVAAAVLEDAIARARALGCETWPRGHFASDGARGRALLREAATRGELFIVWADGSAVATFTLQSVDRDCWPDALDDALYLHRLAVRHAGTGVGRRVLAWCKQQVLARGRVYLRLDCLADDAEIRRYYERAGFCWRRDVDVAGRALSLYEWSVVPAENATSTLSEGSA